jgi:hypothetical protein
MQLIERDDPGFGTAVLYRCAYIWRLLFDRACDRSLNSNCFVVPDETGYTGTVFAQSESDLTTFVKQEFRRFKIAPVHVEDGMFAVHIEPCVLGWKPLRTV